MTKTKTPKPEPPRCWRERVRLFGDDISPQTAAIGAKAWVVGMGTASGGRQATVVGRGVDALGPYIEVSGNVDRERVPPGHVRRKRPRQKRPA